MIIRAGDVLKENKGNYIDNTIKAFYGAIRGLRTDFRSMGKSDARNKLGNINYIIIRPGIYYIYEVINILYTTPTR